MRAHCFRSSAAPRRLGVPVLAGLAAMACGGRDAADLTAPPPSFTVTEESADIFRTFGVDGAPWGTATIRRGPQGVQVHLTVSDPAVQAALEGNAITIWVASFHDPSACAPAPAPCRVSDLNNPLTGGALQRAGGEVLGTGPINLAVNVREGDTKDQIRGTAAGLVDAETDEIHVVVRSHGPPIPGLVDDQIHMVTGGCGINTCVDVVVAIFR